MRKRSYSNTAVPPVPATGEGLQDASGNEAASRLRKDLLNLYASLNAGPWLVLGIRDFNQQVLSTAFDAETRDALGVALRELVEGGLMKQCSPTQYSLTPQGIRAAQEERAARGVRLQSA